MNDTTVVREMLATSLVQVLTIGLYGAGTIVLMAWLDPMLRIVLAVTLAVVALIVVGMLASIRQANEQHQENIATFTSDLERALGSLRTVKAFLAEDRELRRLEGSIDETRRQGLRLARLNCLVSPAIELAANGALLVILLVGGLRVASGDIAVSDLVAFLLYAMFLIMPLIGMLNAVTLLQQGRVSLHRIEHLRSLGTEEIDGATFPTETATTGIEFEGVRFRRGERQILEDVSFSLPITGVVALVGPSGAGKSTILDLIERFETPGSGAIRVHGVDASGIALPELRRHIALVDQDAPVMEGTLRENLAHAAPDNSDLRYLGALTVAGLSDLVGRSADGLDLRVGEHGRSLSGVNGNDSLWRGRCWSRRGSTCWTNPRHSWTRRVRTRCWP